MQRRPNERRRGEERASRGCDELRVHEMSWCAPGRSSLSRSEFESVVDANPKQSYRQLLKGVREILRKNYSQKPQLSSSHKIVRLPIHHHRTNCLPQLTPDRIPTYFSSYDHDLPSTYPNYPTIDRCLILLSRLRGGTVAFFHIGACCTPRPCL